MAEVRRIDASLLPPIRHAVLWPGVAIEAQLQPFDHAATTVHYGAFVTQFADNAANGDGRQLQYPVVHGYRIGEEIGGGGFSKYAPPRKSTPS